MLKHSSKWVWTAILLGLLGVGWTAKAGPAQGSDSVYGECKGVVQQRINPSPLPPRYPTFTCTPVACSPGCAKMQVTTAFGQGQICTCNYIGPQPFCCTVAFLPGGSPWATAFGDCGGYCPAGTSCNLEYVHVPNPDPTTGGVSSYTTHCVGSN